MESGSSEMSIRVLGEYTSLESIENVRVPIPGTGNTVALRDIAVIEDSFKKMTTYTSVNGEPSLGMYIMKASGSNTVQVARRVNEVARLNQILPAGIQIEQLLDSSISFRIQ